MNSEKVKEIKNNLNTEIKLAELNKTRFTELVSVDLIKDILTLINEMESENERFKEKQSKSKEIMESGELSKITKQDMYYYYLTNCGYLENEIERQKQIVRRKGKEIKKLKDRIAELEKEIKENPSYAKGYADGIKNTYEVVIPEKLKQFAEKVLKFVKEYAFKDRKEIYTNGTILVPLFRVEYALETGGQDYQQG